MSRYRFRGVGSAEDHAGRELAYVHFEFRTPSTHECLLYYAVGADGGAECVSGEEIAYGGWETFDGDELAAWMGFYGVDPDEVWQLGNDREGL